MKVKTGRYKDMAHPCLLVLTAELVDGDVVELAIDAPVANPPPITILSTPGLFCEFLDGEAHLLVAHVLCKNNVAGLVVRLGTTWVSLVTIIGSTSAGASTGVLFVARTLITVAFASFFCNFNFQRFPFGFIKEDLLLCPLSVCAFVWKHAVCAEVAGR